MLSADDALDLTLGSHCLLVAGPGTGKTWRIAERVRRVVHRGDCEADDIDVLTLTQSAARKLGAEVPHGRAGTFHSFSLRWLNSLGDAPRRRIVDAWEQKNLIVPDLQAYHGTPRPRRKAIADFLGRLGAGFRENQTGEPELTDVERRLREGWLYLRDFLNFRLFDELAYDLLRHLESGATLSEAPRLILVDEYQDLTPCELALLHAVAEKHGTAVFACGDDRQSIYGFREADPLGLNNFCAVYGIAEPIYMSISRRCPGAVCRYAEAVAAQIPEVPGLTNRPPLRPYPSLPAGTVAIETLPSTVAEARRVHALVADLLSSGKKTGDIMLIVPFAIDVYLKFLSDVASAEGSSLTFYDVRETEPTCEMDEFRTLFALSRLAVNSEDQLALRTLVFLAKGWGDKFLQHLRESGATKLSTAIRSMVDVHTPTAELVEETVRAVVGIRNADTVEAIVAESDAWLRRFCEIDSPDWEAILTLPELHTLLTPELAPEELAGLIEESPLFRDVADALQTAVSSRRADKVPDEGEIGVYTVHQAKGLQAEHVFLLGAFTQAFVDENPADGIRRLYVAVTRARTSLTVTMGRFVRGKNNPLSRYLKADSVELSPHIVEAAQRSGVAITRS